MIRQQDHGTASVITIRQQDTTSTTSSVSAVDGLRKCMSVVGVSKDMPKLKPFHNE